MGIEIKVLPAEDTPLWDAYVNAHPQATLYHLSGWRNVTEKTYGHKTYYLMAFRDTPESNLPGPAAELPTVSHKLDPTSNRLGLSALSLELDRDSDPIVGILPLVHLKHFIFGNSLISIPFFDLGGILAEDEDVEEALLSEAIELGRNRNVDSIELRQTEPISSQCPRGPSADVYSSKLTADSLQLPTVPWTAQIRTHKARMLLKLPESSENLMSSFNSKLRSQIRKPIKEGLTARIGGIEFLDDFYEVFSVNMRDLGSPVHKRHLFSSVLEEFPESARIVVIYNQNRPVAGSMIVGFRDILENPWASALREYNRLSPNMFLYWTMLEYACDNGFTFFDFGRSTPGEGTYKFKEQWGATPYPLHWCYLSSNDHALPDEDEPEKSRFDRGIHYWKKLPVPVTRMLGPMIRKHIGL